MLVEAHARMNSFPACRPILPMDWPKFPLADQLSLPPSH
jgi:hypothetical protein